MYMYTHVYTKEWCCQLWACYTQPGCQKSIIIKSLFNIFFLPLWLWSTELSESAAVVDFGVCVHYDNWAERSWKCYAAVTLVPRMKELMKDRVDFEEVKRHWSAPPFLTHTGRAWRRQKRRRWNYLHSVSLSFCLDLSCLSLSYVSDVGINKKVGEGWCLILLECKCTLNTQCFKDVYYCRLHGITGYGLVYASLYTNVMMYIYTNVP